MEPKEKKTGADPGEEDKTIVSFIKWEMGHDGLEQHVLGWAYHIGPISIYFGE